MRFFALKPFCGLVFICLLSHCGTESESEDLAIQTSSTSTADYIVTVAADATFSPTCREISEGETILWRNSNEDTPVRVVSTAEPFEMVSPMLRGEYVEWAHTFETSGVYDYYDPFSGELGRPVIDSYYGTTTYIGESGTVTRGRVCVKTSATDVTTCLNQCCPLGTDAECAGAKTCQEGICLD